MYYKENINIITLVPEGKIYTCSGVFFCPIHRFLFLHAMGMPDFLEGWSFLSKDMDTLLLLNCIICWSVFWQIKMCILHRDARFLGKLKSSLQRVVTASAGLRPSKLLMSGSCWALTQHINAYVMILLESAGPWPSKLL